MSTVGRALTRRRPDRRNGLPARRRARRRRPRRGSRFFVQVRWR